MDNPPLWVGTFAGELRRKAESAIQTPELTEWVKQKIADVPNLVETSVRTDAKKATK